MEEVRGRTRWRRFGLAFLPGVSAVALMLWLIASGVIAITLSISGIPFVLKASSLAGNNFAQYAEPDHVATFAGNAVNPFLDNSVVDKSTLSGELNLAGTYEAADTVTKFSTAHIADLVQYVCAPLPGPLAGHSLLVVTEGNADATNLTAYAPGLSADSAVFNNMFIGQDLPGTFSQQADNATISNVTQVGLATTAGSFTVNGLTAYAAFVTTCPAVP